MKPLFFAAVARHYLGRPELAEFLALRLPDLRSVALAARNEAAYRLGWHGAVVPTTLNVELTSRCNVACSYCDVNRALGRPHRDLPPERVEELLASAPSIHTLLPFQWGEPLLHDGLDDVLARATARGVRSFLTTNGTLLDGARFARLARAGLGRLTISLDGDPATHAERRGYAQAPVLARLADARAVQRRDRLSTRLDVSMVVDETVADQVEAFRARLAPLCDRVQFIPRLRRAPRTRSCREPSRGQIVVLSDGTITACCADVRGQLALGRLPERGAPDLRALYRNRAWRTLRARHRARAFPAPCSRCDECAVPGVPARFS